MKLAWFIKRLRVMSGREILYRLSQLLALFSLWIRHRTGTMVPESSKDPSRFAFCTAQQPQLARPSLDLSALERDATCFLEGEAPAAGETWRWGGSDMAWHRAPDTGRNWPRRFFGFIDYREGNPYGDIRKLWEPSRLQHLVDLAVLARMRSGDARARTVQLVVGQLESWWASNPPLQGAHYISAMECSLRLIAACHAVDMLRDELRSDTPWRILLGIVASHAALIEKRLSLHSSTGNHTVAEGSGLVYAGLLFPELPHAKWQLERGLCLLEDLSETQVLPDGGGAEQAFAYHVFNLQLLALVEALLKQKNQSVPAAIADAVTRGGSFIAAFEQQYEKLPAIGDSDGGYALSRYFRLKSKPAESTGSVHTFSDAGYTVARINQTPAAAIIFDHGPLGMPPAFGHGHADALSLLLAVEGQEVFIDPGTYTYTGDSEWRRFFRGTRAHNTVTVDSEDQATHESTFLWSRPFEARLIATRFDSKSHGLLLATHDGYQGRGVRHFRGVAWSSGQWLLVWDQLTGTGTHEMELHWHLGATPRSLEDDRFALDLPQGLLSIQCQGGKLSTHCGTRSPAMGWRSRSYGTLEPSPAVKVRHNGSLPHCFTTMVEFDGRRPPADAIRSAVRWMQDQAQ